MEPCKEYSSLRNWGAAGFSERVMITTNFSDDVNQIMKITRNYTETLTW
jgi:hypothetical protein